MTEQPVAGHLLCIGAGYTARFTASAMLAEGWHVSGTTRSREKAGTLEAAGITPVVLDTDTGLRSAETLQATDLLISASPSENTCPALSLVDPVTSQLPALRSIIYYSSTGACGDHDGNWIDEDTPATTKLPRGKARLAAEQAWQAFGETHNLPVYLLRLSGIYGPGRNALATLIRQGSDARRIYKPGQVFNRIHVEDIARITSAILLKQAAGNPPPHRLYNIADDEPAPPQDVVAFAAELLGRPEPPLVPLEEADLSPMGLSFYAENKRIRNARLKADLDISLTYPTYREGLKALLPSVNESEEHLK